jgi:ABC-type Fe3+/spermidine/putrescine transport system ATPase subunit
LLADEVLLVADAALLQSGRQSEVLAHPAGPAVAPLLGIRNLHTGRMRDAGTLESVGTAIATGAGGLPPGTDVEWCIRPEHVELHSEQAGAGQHGATIVDMVRMGAVADLLVVLDGGCELAAVTTDDGVAIGARCRVRLPPERIVVRPSPAGERAEPAVAALG